MAHPVALDLGAAKTLLAFGERAAKQGMEIPGDLQKFIDEPERMARLVAYAKAGAPLQAAMLLDINWAETYKALGMLDEYTKAAKTLVIPSDPSLWVMPVVKGITSNKIVAGHKKLGVKFYLYADDLDVAVPTHDRDPNRDGSYVVSFRRTFEADEENKNLSANQLKERKRKGITLPERLLLGAGFYVAIGQHLDTQSITLCTGSRYSDGGVPYVDWRSGSREVYVLWYSPGHVHDDLRARSEVSA